MFCGRPALLMLASCILLSGAWCASQTGRFPAVRTHSAIETPSGLSSVCQCATRPGNGTVISRFTVWKSRIKSVLEESNPKIIDERDLGPAIVPGQCFVLGTLLSVICTLPTFPPLRC
jgi:hypothetical protein